jgi:hypothetical protein
LTDHPLNPLWLSARFKTIKRRIALNADVDLGCVLHTPVNRAPIDYDQLCGVAPQPAAAEVSDWEITPLKFSSRQRRN